MKSIYLYKITNILGKYKRDIFDSFYMYYVM